MGNDIADIRLLAEGALALYEGDASPLHPLGMRNHEEVAASAFQRMLLYSSYMDCRSCTVLSAFSSASDKVIKVEKRSKNLSTSAPFKHDCDVGTFRLDDPQNRFVWMDDTLRATPLSDSAGTAAMRCAANAPAVWLRSCCRTSMPMNQKTVLFRTVFDDEC